MKLSRIRVEQFKQFRAPCEIRGLEDGINLFTGPNEAGKSTLVEAIRAAFFERHRSGSVDDLRPWGDASAAPTVELDFSIGGQEFRLVKSFLTRKRCQLHVAGRQLDSAEAEDHLADLLGFRYAGRGASGAEHWGIPGLLWIQQGRAQELREAVGHATGQLRSVLSESLGEVTSTGGDGVIAVVEARRNELLTQSTGKPRGAYGEALDQEKSLNAEIAELDSAISAWRQQVETLAALRRDQAGAEAEKPWIGLREQEQAAQERLTAIGRLQESVAAERRQAGQLEDRQKLLRDRLAAFEQQEKNVASRADQLDAARARYALAAGQVEEWRAKHGEAERQHEAARSRLRRARDEERRQSLIRDFETVRSQAEKAAIDLAQAEAENTRLQALRVQGGTLEMGAKNLETLRAQDRRLKDLKIQLAAVATGLRFNLEDGRSLRIGEEVVTGQGERRLQETTVVTLPGIGTLEISPGGLDLAPLRRDETELRDRQAALLDKLGLDSLEAAEARQQAHAQVLAEIRTVEATLRTLAPQGIDALRGDLTVSRARHEEIAAVLRQLPPDSGGEAILTVTRAEADEEAARTLLAEINEKFHAALLVAGREQTAEDTASRELAEAEALLAAPGRSEQLAAANRDLVDARAEQAALLERIKALDTQLAEAHPDIVQQDVERFRRSAEQQEKSFGERRDLIFRLEAELQAAGAQGLEERRAERVRDLVQAQRRALELKRRAEAADYLLRLLRDKRQMLTRRLQAPLQKHLSHYLQMLFPDARLDIDENLAPGPLSRNGPQGIEAGAFEDLSFGAREQMGIISRLAYAGLLKEAGRPTLIILDDALVHSDKDRLEQMKRILFDSATRHQILLFTCHPEKWRDLGVAERSLERIRLTA